MIRHNVTRNVRAGGCRITFTLLSLIAAHVAWGGTQNFVVETKGAPDAVAAAIEAIGGKVTQRYVNIDALAVSMPEGKSLDLLAVAGVNAAYKDGFVGEPYPLEMAEIPTGDVMATVNGAALDDALESAPDGLLHNLVSTGAIDLFNAGITGDGVLVAVIDSGTANVDAIAGAVIGGENFVPGDGEPSANSTMNGPHGTWVGTTIAADIAFCFDDASTYANSLLLNGAGSVIPGFPGCPAGAQNLIPMFGTAPDASLYAMKVFPAAGGGAPESRIIAAMDRAITLRKNYNNGMPFTPVAGSGTEDDPFVYDSAPIEVVNMSLGGPTLFAGRDLEDQLTMAMQKVGIVLVASAGNEGHAAMTGGSPGTGIGSLTSGAASATANERALRDLQFGLGFGAFFRPSEHMQMATFSSRGPTADGRIDPENVANGFAVFAQGASGALNIVSGTSFSAPNTTGGVALLRQAYPDASPAAIMNALVNTSNPFLIPGAGAIDQGHGFVDFLAAAQYVPDASDTWPQDDRSPSSKVRKNVEKSGQEVLRLKGKSWSTTVSDLVPGEVAHFFIESTAKTDELTVTVSNITPALPPGQQNLFFGDDVFVKFQNAMTSNDDDPFVQGQFVNADTTFTIPNPQTGLIRVAVMGDWTNAGNVSVDLNFAETRGNQGDETDEGEVMQGETQVLSLDIPGGTGEAVFELAWENNWGHYPTDDLDLILVDPSGALNFNGATLASPERVVIADPTPGTWLMAINGFTVHDELDDDDDDEGPTASEWELRVTADGERLELDDD